MSTTHSALKPRSRELKALDQAIAAYHNASSKGPEFAKVQQAFDAWKRKEGAKWKDSVRNKSKAMERLSAVLDAGANHFHYLTLDDLHAMRDIRAAHKAYLRTLFDGRELKLRTSSALKSGATGAKEAYSLVSQSVALKDAVGNGVRSASATQNAALAGQVATLLRTVCGGAVQAEEVMQHLGLGSVAVTAANIAPAIGAITSGGKAIVAWIGVGQKAWAAKNMREATSAFRAGDPIAAFEAVMVMVDREITDAIADAGIASASFSVKTLGLFLDAGAATGPAAGILEAVASLLKSLFIFSVNYKEAKKANQLIKNGEISLKLFHTCPILGCYFVCVADTSVVINVAVSDYGKPGWTFDAASMAAAVRPVIEKAGAFIRSSPYHIPEYDKAKYVVEDSTGFIASRKKKVSDALMDRLPARMQSLIGHTPAPKVDKSRMQGISSEQYFAKNGK